MKSSQDSKGKDPDASCSENPCGADPMERTKEIMRRLAEAPVEPHKDMVTRRQKRVDPESGANTKSKGKPHND